MNNINEEKNISAEVSAEETESAVMMRRKIKQGCSRAGAVILWQQLLASVLLIIINTAISVKLTAEIMAENPKITQEGLTLALTQAISEAVDPVVLNAVLMVIANIFAIVMVFSGRKLFKLKDTLGKSKLPISGTVLAALSIIGIQGASIFIQSFVMSITGFSGMNEAVMSSLSFTDDLVTNIILFLYMVVLGPVLEELMFRSGALNFLSPVSRAFGLFASSLLFGLMHMNFNQIFNGFLLGLILGYIALKSGSVRPAIICHMAANLNAFIASFVFEYKLIDVLGEEKAVMGEMIMFGIEMVIGIAALVILLRKYGKVNDNDAITGFIYNAEPSERKELTVNTLLKTPTFWVSAVLSIYVAVSLVTQITQL